MYRIKVYYSLAMILLLSGTMLAGDIKINFSTSNINDARNLASQEGKLIFVDFYADWCTPCKWMEQTTFADEEVVKTLNGNFIAVKANIDEAEGYDLKNAFEVRYLPTMLIFNSEGQLLDRVEETLSPRKLLELLEKYNAPEHKKVVKYDFNTSPTQAKRAQSESMKQTASEYTKYFDEPQKNDVFRVQVGVFQRHEGANEMVKTLQQLFVEQVTVTNELKNGVPVYKVRLGQFTTQSEAENFKNTLKNEYNMIGIVI